MKRAVPMLALAILSLFATENFGCIFLSSPACAYTDNDFGPSEDASHSGDECLCCCLHMLIRPTTVLTEAGGVVRDLVSPIVTTLATASLPVYHPPQTVIS